MLQKMMNYTQAEREKRIRERLTRNFDTIVTHIASGEKITLIPTRSAVKVFHGRETRLDIDLHKSEVGGVVNE